MSPPNVLTIEGSSALSPFQSERLAEKLGVDAVRARYVHYIHLADGATLGSEEGERLRSLLAYGSSTPPPPSGFTSGGQDGALHRYAVHTFPRHGTISPWSSQATGIASVCRVSPHVRRIERGTAFHLYSPDSSLEIEALAVEAALYDRMTESVTVGGSVPDLGAMFAENAQASPLTVVKTRGNGTDKVDAKDALRKANKELGLALDEGMVEYLAAAFGEGGEMGREPTDVELFMFSVVNSDHCRHLVFNADWTIDGVDKDRSLFQMIRNTYEMRANKRHVLSAYSDNAAVFEGPMAAHWAPNRVGEWSRTVERVHYLAKVETHNMPTGISAFPGAATGSGGEIRDEGAVGRGSKPKAGLCGFNVSDMLIPGFKQPWELDVGKPFRITSALNIMLEAPIGSARYNNEFGRPCILGYFRTLTTEIPTSDTKTEIRGYHKPIMIAGGVGSVRPALALKDAGMVKPGDLTIVLGGPAMLIGLGGGSASSVTSGQNTAELDFASVQRGNAEVQRRAQEVIDSCAALGTQSPIKFVHDVGAGGLSNALPELVHDSNLGATFELREVESADKSMSPLQIWCCEAQERYVLAVGADHLNEFRKIAMRERCGFSVVGKTTGASETGEKRLILMDRDSKDNPKPIDLPMTFLFGKPPKMKKVVESRKPTLPTFDNSLSSYVPSANISDDILQEAADRVLSLPAVGSKNFLITISDRTVGGLVARDQLVGPWQTPVADVAVTATALIPGLRTGEAMGMGERPLIAMISPAASARMAVAEALLNLSAASIADRLDKVSLSANWMAAANYDGAALYEAVEALGMDLCPKLGIPVPVGKDSMSMATKWEDPESGEEKQVVAPISLVVSAFAPVTDITHTWTPTLRRLEDVGESLLMYVDLSFGKARKAMGGSCLAQCFKQVGSDAPDVHDVQLLKDFFDAVDQLHASGVVLAYHDVSDGGLFTTLVEMAFAGRCGIEINLDDVARSPKVEDVIEALFSEELAVVFQIRKRHITEFNRAFATCGPPKGLIKTIGRIPKTAKQEVVINHGTQTVFRAGRAYLQQKWAATSYQMQRLRDNPTCADAEYQALSDWQDPGLTFNLTWDLNKNIMPWYSGLKSSLSNKPKVAILREEGSNGAAELAFAFESAGFIAIDVHMTDILSGRVSLAQFHGLGAVGGFSYGDVLGAGRGWAQSVLQHAEARREFETFFARADSFALGVCNGCQMLARLAPLIPGASAWPTFEENSSNQFEARYSMVKINDASSVFLHGMAGSTLPIVVSHGEGRADFWKAGNQGAKQLVDAGQVAFQFVDNRRRVTSEYPLNPNGSPLGITGVTAAGGRVLACMPHPERTILAGIGSYIPPGKSREWNEVGPWARMFQSARRWVG